MPLKPISSQLLMGVSRGTGSGTAAPVGMVCGVCPELTHRTLHTVLCERCFLWHLHTEPWAVSQPFCALYTVILYSDFPLLSFTSLTSAEMRGVTREAVPASLAVPQASLDRAWSTLG